MMFELGNRMPRITWFKLAFTCGASAAGAVGAGAGLLQAATNTSNDKTVNTRIDATSVENCRESLLQLMNFNPTRARASRRLKT
jgi:hypothetical protein